MRRSLSAQHFPRNQSRRWASLRKPVLLFPVGIFFMADLFEHASAPAPGIQLNPEQRAAAHHGEGPLVVVAGAGTGKTRVITERIRYLLETQRGLAGEEIVWTTVHRQSRRGDETSRDCSGARARRNGGRAR